jgi:PII-like signaling protein
MVNQPLGVADPTGSITVFQRKLQRDGMRVQLVPQGAGQNLFALAQDEITAQRHHRAHGYGQKQNQSGAQAHTACLSGERRIGGLSGAALFYGIKQFSQQISRHTHEAHFMLLSEIPLSQMATSEKVNLQLEEFPFKSRAS